MEFAVEIINLVKRLKEQRESIISNQIRRSGTSRHGVKSYETVLELCKDVGMDWLSFITFKGTHEFCKDDSPITALIDELTAL